MILDTVQHGVEQRCCIHCRARLKPDESFCHPFRLREVMCRACCETLPVCVGCERHIKHRNSIGVRATAVPFCTSCASLPSVAPMEVPQLLQEAVNLLTRLTEIDFIALGHRIIVEPSSPHKIQNAMTVKHPPSPSYEKASHNNIYGICCFHPDDQNKIKIYILEDLSSLLFGAFLCHELVHALFFLLRQRLGQSSDVVCQPSLSCILEEGLCHWAAACWLHERLCQVASLPKSDVVPLLPAVSQGKFWLRKFSYGQNPEFSVGFQWAKTAVEQCGWQGAIEYLVGSCTRTKK